MHKHLPKNTRHFAINLNDIWIENRLSLQITRGLQLTDQLQQY